MNKIIFALSLAGLLCLSSRSFASPECRVRHWTLKQTATLPQIKRSLDHLPRAMIVQIAWGEMLKANPSKSVAMPVLQYLAGTDPSKELRGYFKTMGVMMSGGRMPAEAIKGWPKRAKLQKSKYSLQQLCQIYKQAGG